MKKNENAPLSKEKWDHFFITDIAEYHGFSSQKEFYNYVRNTVPEFYWHYDHYLMAFEITKSPLWKALT